MFCVWLDVALAVTRPTLNPVAPEFRPKQARPALAALQSEPSPPPGLAPMSSEGIGRIVLAFFELTRNCLCVFFLVHTPFF